MLVDSADTLSITADAGNVTVGALTAASTVGILASSGSIVDDADDTVTDITAGGLITLTATANINGPGATDDRLDLAAGSTVDASSTTAGAIRLRGAGALTLQDVDTANGPITSWPRARSRPRTWIRPRRTMIRTTSC